MYVSLLYYDHHFDHNLLLTYCFYCFMVVEHAVHHDLIIYCTVTGYIGLRVITKHYSHELV